MNKTFLGLILASASAFPAVAAQYYLEAIESKMGFNDMNFFYNKDNRLASFSENDNYGDGNSAQLRYDFSYDAQGRQTMMLGFQKLEGAPGDGFLCTMKYFFTYDAQGHVSSQTNYNINLSGGFKLGGIYDYSYDAEGRLAKRFLYFDEARENVREIKYYTYNTKGELIETQVNSSYTTEQEGTPEQRTLMTYNDLGQLVKRVHYRYLTSSWDYDVTEEFAYDTKGNLTQRLNYRSSPEMASEKDVYTYKDITATDVVLPIYVGSDFDENFDNFVMVTSPNVIDQHTLYKIAYETSSLDVFDVCTYSYATERPDYSSISPISAPSVPEAIYDLMGCRVSKPEHGVYIKVSQGKSSKIIL